MRLGLRNGIGIHWITVRMKTKCENEEWSNILYNIERIFDQGAKSSVGPISLRTPDLEQKKVLPLIPLFKKTKSKI